MRQQALELVSAAKTEGLAVPERPPGEFASLYRATVQPLRAYLSRMLGNACDAQDVAHDAYLKVYDALDSQPVRKPGAFLFTIARRLALNHLRHRKIGRIQGGEDNLIAMTPASGPTVPQVVMARQDWAHMESIIESLPSGCRTVLRLSKVEYLTHKEIGKRLGIATSTVEKQHARALRLIFEALETLKPDDRAAGMAERASNE